LSNILQVNLIFLKKKNENESIFKKENVKKITWNHDCSQFCILTKNDDIEIFKFSLENSFPQLDSVDFDSTCDSKITSAGWTVDDLFFTFTTESGIIHFYEASKGYSLKDKLKIGENSITHHQWLDENLLVLTMIKKEEDEGTEICEPYGIEFEDVFPILF
jgi:hypothetical protein